MEIQTEPTLEDVLERLRQGNPDKARQIISILFENDIDNKVLAFINKCCSFWILSEEKLRDLNDPFDRNENIISEWKTIQTFYFNDKDAYEPAKIAIQRGYFSNALEGYKKLFEEKDAFQRAEVFKNAGICYKKLGEFQAAKNLLTEANKLYPNQASVIAELADCYSLCGEDKFGKLLFREAFFIDPGSIDLDFLDSTLIRCLIKKAQDKGHKGKTLQYWIPVYGVLNGVFNIKRELSSQEVALLKKDIYAMENEYKDPACNSGILVPHLLNYYFRLMDHYVLAHESVAKINEVLLKIKILDSSVYEAYR